MGTSFGASGSPGGHVEDRVPSALAGHRQDHPPGLYHLAGLCTIPSRRRSIRLVGEAELIVGELELRLRGVDRGLRVCPPSRAWSSSGLRDGASGARGGRGAGHAAGVVSCPCVAVRFALAVRCALRSFCVSSRATTCPARTRSPRFTVRSIMRPAIRNASGAWSSAWMLPVSTTGTLVSRFSIVTARTGRIAGGGASCSGRQAASSIAMAEVRTAVPASKLRDCLARERTHRLILPSYDCHRMWRRRIGCVEQRRDARKH